jgi:hypothetical protein
MVTVFQNIIFGRCEAVLLNTIEFVVYLAVGGLQSEMNSLKSNRSRRKALWISSYSRGGRCNNLFKDLDSRDLTDAEESIIAERVALQQRMLEEYEKREKARQAGAIFNDLGW